MNAASSADGIAIAKRRITQGRWFWTFTPNAGDIGEDGTPLSP
jgi:hypothetical protein